MRIPLDIHCILLTRYLMSETDFDEWCNHHIKVGFAHIHVFDNGCAFDLSSACRKYGDTVSYEKVTGHVCQYDLYTKYIKTCCADYVMPIDDDEYLCLGASLTDIADLIEELAYPDCVGIRWKYLFPKDLMQKRTGRVLDYCTESNRDMLKFFRINGDSVIKCLVKCSEFETYMTADDNLGRNHIPVTKTDDGATLCNGTKTKVQRVSIKNDYLARLIHCPYKGCEEFLKTRGAQRFSVAFKALRARNTNRRLLKWLENQTK